MDQKKRIGLGVGILAVIFLGIVGIDALRRTAASAAGASGEQPTLAVTLAPGSVPIYVNGSLTAGFSPDDLSSLEQVSFVEPLEGKTQSGWLLSDVLSLYLKSGLLTPDAQILVSSSSRKKSAQLTWAEIDQKDNMVMFDLSNRGTLKLVSKLEKLDVRDEWVQDVDKIEITLP